MPRLAGPLVAAAVVAVAAAAVLDAARREEPPPSPAERLRAAGIAGELVWSDARCRRHALRLPALARRDFRTRGCGVFTRRDSLGVAGGEIAWYAFPGPGGSTVVLSREDVAAEVGDGFRPLAAAWLGDLRYAAVFGGARTVVGLFQGASALRLAHRPGETGAHVRASAGGGYYAVLAADGSLAVHDRDGRPLDLPAEGDAVAWSPDERFVAIARGGALSIRPAGGGDEIASIPVAAVDVDWRR